MNESVAGIFIASEGDTVAFGVPFTKIDKKARTVEGFATLDNVDHAFDVVDAEASKEAFASWIGNIREMHGAKAVGKAVSIEERVLEKNGKTYKGIWVKARISKGAPDTWEKILDGTLNGFSIGGKILERRPDVVKADDGRYKESRVTRITKYILAELSVVDNPMNPLALFEGIAKGLLVKSMGDALVAGEAVIENKGLFYCDTCDVAQMDDIDFRTIECPTCDNKMMKIGEVAESPTVTELRKMVDAFGEFKNSQLEKIQNYNYTPDEQNIDAGFGDSGEWKPNPDVQDANPDLVTQESMPNGTPQTGSPAPHSEKAEPALAAQTAEDNEHIEVTLQVGDVSMSAKGAASRVFEALKSRSEFTGRSIDKEDDIEKTITQQGGKYCVSSKDGSKKFGCYDSMEQAQARLKQIEGFGKAQHEDREFVSTLLNFDLFRVTNSHKTPPKGYPTDTSKYADPANYKYPIDSPARVRAAMVYFNKPGQRQAGGYSMSEWASIGRKIASAANTHFATGHSYSSGKVAGPGMTKADTEQGEFIINLQKNTTDDNTNMINVLQSLSGYLIDDDSSINKGGENPTLDTKELEKILDILETATSEVRDVLKGFNVERVNNENGSGPTLGASDPGDAGVGTSDANDGGSPMPTSEVAVATAAAMPAPDNGPDKVVPDAIATDGTGVGQGITADSGPEKVLPHADLASTSATTKSDEADDLMKVLAEKIEAGFGELRDRLATVENSGGVKKSVEIEKDLQKSDEGPFWGGNFSADELTNN